jgi:predicted nucleic acid-binding protein
MGDSRYLTSEAVLDASPLIYLAKLEALDVLTIAVGSASTTPAVLEEVTRPQMTYRHPDAIEIEAAVDRGTLSRLTLHDDERDRARRIGERVPGLHAGETEVLAVALERRIPAVIFERPARRIAASLGADLIDVTELLVAGTRDRADREKRVLRFAGMVNMRLDQTIELFARIGSNRIPGRSEQE